MSEDTKKQVGMGAFNVKAKSEDGIKVELNLPDGTATGEFLVVRGADSPTFRKAQARNNRTNLDLLKLGKNGKKPDPADLAMRQAKAQRELVAVLVVGWSFLDEDENPVPCTIEAVADFFDGAPQIQEQVDQVAGERRNFFSKPSSDSANTPEEISG